MLLPAAPSPPENVCVSRKRTHSVIKIRWNAPASIVVAHYEIAKTTRRGNYDEKPIVVPAIKFSATFKKLNQKTRYYFKVRACNGFYTSDWSDEIEARTRIHKAVKAALSPLAWAAGTVITPLTAPFSVGLAAGMIAHESGGNNASIAAGAAGGVVGGAALGILAGPLAGAVWAYLFVNGADEFFLSDHSDDEGTIIIEDQ